MSHPKKHVGLLDGPAGCMPLQIVGLTPWVFQPFEDQLMDVLDAQGPKLDGIGHSLVGNVQQPDLFLQLLSWKLQEEQGYFFILFLVEVCRRYCEIMCASAKSCIYT